MLFLLYVLQGAALKYIPTVIPDILNERVLPKNELARLLVDFLSNIPRDRLANQKLICIQDIVNSPLFSHGGSYGLGFGLYQI